MTARFPLGLREVYALLWPDPSQKARKRNRLMLLYDVNVIKYLCNNTSTADACKIIQKSVYKLIETVTIFYKGKTVKLPLLTDRQLSPLYTYIHDRKIKTKSIFHYYQESCIMHEEL